ncbi:AI-2E family transporter, partial [Enterococcus faecium]
NVSIKLLSIVLYLIVVALVYLVITKYAPILLNQSAQLVKSVTDFYQKADSNNELLEYLLHLVQTSDYVQKIQNGVVVVINYLY